MTVVLTPKDNGSGVKATQCEYTFNGTRQTCPNPIAFSQQGTYTIYYKSLDNANNPEGEKSTTFGIDTTAPTGSLAINNGSATSYATLVYLNPSGTDGLSGISQMHFRDSGGAWSSYQAYSNRALWQLASASNGTYTVEAQFKDMAGNESAIYQAVIVLNLNPNPPSSSNYKLLKSTLGASGQQNSASTGYRLNGTLGQPSASSPMNGTSYQANMGYWGKSSSQTVTCGTLKVPITPNFTEIYNNVTLNEQPAPVGTVIEATDPRGNVVGCFVVTVAGQYGTMRIYGEDTSVTPNIAGLRDGETVTFKVSGLPAQATPTLVWHNDHSQQPINLVAPATATTQTLTLQPGWNLISFYIEPTNPAVAQVLASIATRYSRVLGEGTSYNPSLPAFSTLKELHAGKGYYLFINGATAVTLLIEGTRLTAPLTLHQGWNWIGYLPSSTLSIGTALASINGHYQRVLSLDKSYNPSLPTFSTLKDMAPGQGYLLYMNDATPLVYPASSMLSQVRERLDRSEGEAMGYDSLTPTPYLTILYGQLPKAEVGTKIEVITPRGEVAGCFVVAQAEQFGFMPVYGGENGFQANEPLRFRVNGQTVESSAPLLWQDDKVEHHLNLTLEAK